MLMPNKRIIGAIIVKDGLAIQSFKYSNYLPLGSPSIIASNLDKWGADEILILSIDRTTNKIGPDFSLISKIRKQNISTPLIYGGGIRNLEDAINVIQMGAERIVIDKGIENDSNLLEKISSNVGSQALIASIPCILKEDGIYKYDYINRKTSKFDNKILDLINSDIFSEVYISDVSNDGGIGTFQEDILKYLKNINKPIILFGGITKLSLIDSLLNNKKVSAIAIGNSLNYSENRIQFIKSSVKNIFVRKPYYSKEPSIGI